MAAAIDGRSVLVLEDSILVALAIEAALADQGFTAIIAGSLAAAEERLARERPVAALLDLQLPDGLSFDLARRLHERGCKVALCSGADADSVPSGLEFAARFRKPMAAENLADWVVRQCSPDGA